jgi:hypothetical protein
MDRALNIIMAQNLKRLVIKRVNHPRFRKTKGEIARDAGMRENILWHLMNNKILLKPHHLAGLERSLNCKAWRLNPHIAPKSLRRPER